MQLLRPRELLLAVEPPLPELNHVSAGGWCETKRPPGLLQYKGASPPIPNRSAGTSGPGYLPASLGRSICVENTVRYPCTLSYLILSYQVQPYAHLTLALSDTMLSYAIGLTEY